MKTDALDIDADGLPLFRPDPAVAREAIDVGQIRALQLQQLRKDIHDALASGEADPWNPEAIKAEGRRRLEAHRDSTLGA